ncbi:murein biosynthesis integral membrane protein MurJ [Romboutsia sedimentorum]|uniref:Probable lipid II flippase MurJ n=1 Tax=Romboutsia sedimentorum TaxID=1368474 RepID=A0ABT7EFS5_9FIRM|nr:murein biosynthesis integral membrane protein MurJ [Romboutsia sedimentorum]MDK2564876.1 murein biosynthesis integral membrane protein MurJ [Romboutsia sedimentorum]
MSKTTKKTAIILMIIILVSKVTGFLRDIVLAQTFGAGNITDAYLTALNIPVVLFTGISASLGTTFIPMFFNIKENEGNEGIHKFTSNILNIIVIISIAFIIIGMIFTPYIVKIFAMGFKGEVLDLTVGYSRILLFSMIFIATNGLISSFLVGSGNVYISGLVSIPFNIFVIVAIFLGSMTNSYVMVYGTLFAYVAQLLFQIPFLLKKGYKHKFVISLKDENIRQILYLVMPVFLGSYVNQINTVVNRTLASTLESGSITALDYANKLNIFAVGVIVISLSTVMYPILSKLASENNMKHFKQNISKSINIIIISMVPIMIMIMDLSTPIVRILFENGSFDQRATYLTSTALFYYSIGIVAYGLNDILSKAFYSLQDTKTPVKNATMSVIINVFLSIVLVKYMGIGGLALAGSISAIVSTILLFVSLRKKIGQIGLKNILVIFTKVILSAVIMGIVIRSSYNILYGFGANMISESRELMAIIASICVVLGLIVYVCLILLLNVKEAKEIVNLVNNKMINIIKR